MKNILKLIVFIGLLLSGCVVITLPTPEPLVEKVIGGTGPDKVLVVDISGVISDDDGGGVIGLETEANLTARIKEEMTLALKDRHVKGLVMRINSPGGSVTTCDIINHEIRKLRREKKIPVVAQL